MTLENWAIQRACNIIFGSIGKSQAQRVQNKFLTIENKFNLQQFEVLNLDQIQALRVQNHSDVLIEV